MNNKEVIIKSTDGLNNLPDEYRILMTMSYIIPNYELASDILKKIKSLKRYRAIDILYGNLDIKKVYNYPASFDENGMSGALQKSLKSVLELSAADKIGHIQATQFVDELIQIPGQCHVKKDGECFTTLRQWRPNDLAAVDFDNELLKISMKDEKVAKADYDGMIKVAKDALQEQYINSGNRPISTEALEGLVDMLHQRSGGRRSDIA